MGFKSKLSNETIQEEIEENNEENIDDDSQEYYESDEKIEEINEEIEEIKPIVKKKVVKKVAKRGKLITTPNGEQIEVIMKKKPKKPKVIYLSESEDENEIIQIAPKKKARGRPKKSTTKQVVEYVDGNGNKVDTRKKAKQTIINHDIKGEKPLTASEIKLIELEEKLAELSAVSGKTILSTKKNKVDKRMVKPPTEKQLAARKLFLENNKIRNLKKREEKEAKKKNSSKENVKEVLNELSNIKKEKVKQLEQKKEEVKIETKVVIDDFFN